MSGTLFLVQFKQSGIQIRSLALRYTPQSRCEVMKHIHRLWNFDVYMEQVNDEGELIEHCLPC
ncbi:MAG: hypothetical protein GPOALKHO_000473 [Sodalis sp.]|nr:MAG: hypothetical protein GPOALKHO_000473 [Sodalis sp.]